MPGTLACACGRGDRGANIRITIADACSPFGRQRKACQHTTSPGLCLHCGAAMAPTLPRVGCRVRASPVRVHNRARAAPSRSVTLYDLSDQIVDYCSAWAWQKAYASALASEREQASRRDQALIILQHEPTYTLGTGSSLEHVKFDPEDPPHPLFRTERGGEVTFHGPGQLTVYPIVDLREHGADLHLYMRALEQIAIDALHAVSDIDAHRIEGLTGALWHKPTSSHLANTFHSTAADRVCVATRTWQG